MRHPPPLKIDFLNLILGSYYLIHNKLAVGVNCRMRDAQFCSVVIYLV